MNGADEWKIGRYIRLSYTAKNNIIITGAGDAYSLILLFGVEKFM